MRRLYVGATVVSCSICVAGVSIAQQQTAHRTPARTPTASRAAAPAALGNSDVVALVKAGFSEDLIVVRIKQAPAKDFDLSTKGMLDLKTAGVSERLIAVMFGGPDPGVSRAEPKTAPPGSSPAPAANDGSAGVVERLDAGIYLKATDKYVPLEPTVFSGGKTGGVLTSGLTMGIKKAKWKAVVRSPHAGQRVRTTRPDFYFYFENKNSGLGSSAAMFGASSPNEFVLARMTQDDDERQLIVGEFGAFGASSGTRSQDTVPLTITRLQPGIYKVTPVDALPVGEYCFFYAAGASTFVASGTGKLFDFGVESDAR